jgi:hypothetical protein
MIRSLLKFAISGCILCLPECVSAQQGAHAIQPPALGFVFHSGSGTLTPIIGVPGASVLGASMDSGLGSADAVVSPNQDYALLAGGEPRALYLLRLPSSDVSMLRIDGAIAPDLMAPDLMTLSPGGDAAALYRASDGVLQILTGMPDAPQVVREIPAASLGGMVRSVAVADDGRAILVAVAGQVLLIPADGIARPLPVEGPVSAIAFRPRSHDAIIAGKRDGHVSLILGEAENMVIKEMAAPGDGFLKPVAVAFSLDGARVFAASSEGALVEFDPAGGPPQSLSCECRINAFDRLAGNAVFRLTNPSGGPLLVFDGDAPQPRIVFIPTAAEGGTHEGR